MLSKRYRLACLAACMLAIPAQALARIPCPWSHDWVGSFYSNWNPPLVWVSNAIADWLPVIGELLRYASRP